jgi:hypothetical protein
VASGSRLRVLIAGGGVAAVEALLALRSLAGHLVVVTVLAPEPELVRLSGSSWNFGGDPHGLMVRR